MTILYQLMRETVDYAGLFPPADLPLDVVVANYANYLQSDARSMLGRLIVPAMRLEELDRLAEELMPNGTDAIPWRISVLAPAIEQATDGLVTDKFDAAMESIRAFNERHGSSDNARAIVDALEVKVPTVESVAATIERLPVGVSSFLETSDLSNAAPLIDQIGQVDDGRAIYAKIRTGGVTPDLIPTPSDVARFIAACARQGVGFKATAGLHHPIRGRYRLTYEKDAPEALLFGFLNVFVATVIAFEHEVSADVLTEILAAEDASRFVFEDHLLSWGNFQVSSERVAEFRKRGILSFGSCSFTEPTTELLQLPNMSYTSVFSG